MYIILWQNFDEAGYRFVEQRKKKNNFEIKGARGNGCILLSELRKVFKNDCGIIDVKDNPFYILHNKILGTGRSWITPTILVENLCFHMLWFSDKSHVIRLLLDDNLIKKARISKSNIVAGFEAHSLELLTDRCVDFIDELTKSCAELKEYNSAQYNLKRTLDILEEDHISIEEKDNYVVKLNSLYYKLEDIIQDYNQKQRQMFIQYLKFLRSNMTDWSTEIVENGKIKKRLLIDNFFNLTFNTDDTLMAWLDDVSHLQKTRKVKKYTK